MTFTGRQSVVPLRLPALPILLRHAFGIQHLSFHIGRFCFVLFRGFALLKSFPNLFEVLLRRFTSFLLGLTAADQND